ncbi:MAG TPA: ATP-binding protein [Alphaproteobacteria bacterium]|nr:ATP-binding protein [Alphaproteobacteria bacterium]
MTEQAGRTTPEFLPPRLRSWGLLAKFLLLLVPVFLGLAAPGIGYLVHLQLRSDQDALARRIGNQSARTAAALGRHDLRASPDLAADLLAPLATDRALVCAEFRSADGTLLAASPPAQGCLDRKDIGELVLPVRNGQAGSLLVRFSDAELREAQHLEGVLAVSTLTAAFLCALLAATIGFRLIVGRPLRLLLAAIHHSSVTGEKQPVGMRRADELGAVIQAFDAMVLREKDREAALTQTNERLWSTAAELKRLNEELEQRVQERTAELEREKVLAEAASEAKSRFVWTMSHELRTPLNAIIGFSQLMVGEIFGALGDRRYAEYARDIETSGRHLLAIISRILDVAKIESGTEPLHEETVDVAEMVDECLHIVQPLCQAGGVALHRRLPAMPLPLRIDRTKMKQVLINLLGNGAKFTPAGGSVELSVATRANGDVEFVVTDTGVGMREEDIPVALSVFGQIEKPLNRRHGGTGLGLPLARMMVEMHGGELIVESQPDRGCRVTVRLPRSRAIGRGTIASASR